MRDLRFALRQLRRQPGFAAVAILTLALGIGANTAIFSIIQAVLLAPLPYPAPAELMVLHESDHHFQHSSVSYPNFLDWQRMNRSFSGLAAYRNDTAILSGQPGQAPEHLRAENVSANFFQVLGVHLADGPGFTAAEDRPNGAPQVILSYGFWQRHLGGSPGTVGRTVALNGKPYLVVGILPKDFWFIRTADIFTPLGQYLPIMLMQRGNRPGIVVAGRLKPGVSLAAAQQDVSGIARELARLYPKADGASGARVDPMRADFVRGVGSMLWLLLAAVGVVLLIACANIANLLLARGTGRRRELAVRGALGAGGGRLLRQMLAEALVLGLAGAAGGLLLAEAAVRAAPSLIPTALPRLQQVGLNGPVLLFALAAALLSSLLFGLLPAWQSSRLNVNAVLHEGGRGASARQSRLQSALAIAEIALALVLLTGAGLLLRTMARLGGVNPGFSTHNLLTAQLALAPGIQSNGAAIAAAHRALLERVNALPGVVAAAETSLVPLGSSDSETGFWQGGPTQPPADQVHTAVSFFTSPRYLETMRIPLVAGRYLEAGDDLQHPNAVVIDTALAREYFPRQNPIGKRLYFQFMGGCTVVGVVGHVKFWGLGDESGMIQAQVYMAIDQIPLQYMAAAAQGADLMVRTAAAPLGVVAAVRTAVAGPGRDQPIYGIETMDGIIADSVAQRRFLMELLGMFAGLAVLLAGIGIYGVLSYQAAQRTHEIGIRMALGARPGAVAGAMLGRGARLALWGTAAGLIGAALTTRYLASSLYGVAPMDPVTLAAAAGFLFALALLASYLPARRAARVDPVIALRLE